jgi:hypothetical protein
MEAHKQRIAMNTPRSLTYDELQTLHALGATLGPLTREEDRVYAGGDSRIKESRRSHPRPDSPGRRAIYRMAASPSEIDRFAAEFALAERHRVMNESLWELASARRARRERLAQEHAEYEREMCALEAEDKV